MTTTNFSSRSPSCKLISRAWPAFNLERNNPATFNSCAIRIYSTGTLKLVRRGRRRLVPPYLEQGIGLGHFGVRWHPFACRVLSSERPVLP